MMKSIPVSILLLFLYLLAANNKKVICQNTKSVIVPECKKIVSNSAQDWTTISEPMSDDYNWKKEENNDNRNYGISSNEWVDSDDSASGEIVCLHGFPADHESFSQMFHWRAITIINCTSTILDIREVHLRFPYLKNFTVTGGNVTEIKGTFAGLLEIINITGTQLEFLPSSIFHSLPSVRMIDLRNNSLVQIDPTIFDGIPNFSSVQKIFLTGNLWHCDESISWIVNNDTENDHLRRIIEDKDEMRCNSPYKDRPLIYVMEIMKSLSEECLGTQCECKLDFLSKIPGARQSFKVFASYNCSYRNLTDMPDFVPKYTTTVHLEGNEISEVKPLLSNKKYQGVLDLYLDNNSIETLALLDGSTWLENFRLLSLRNNKLSDFPTYVFENLLAGNSNGDRSLYLGNNPWRCDCQFIPGFQELLIKHGKMVKDIEDVRCSLTSENPMLARRQIKELSRAEICTSPDSEPWLDPWTILNIILASLILLVLGRFSYDYWNFKRTGKLPRFVTRIL